MTTLRTRQISSGTASTATSTNLPEVSGPVGISGKMPTGNANILYSTPARPERFLFDWKAFPETPIPPRDRREIFREAGGPVLNLPRQLVQSPEAIFLSIWDSAIMGHIVTETNRYAEEEISKRQDTLGTQSRLHRWTPTNVDELYLYFGILLAMGLCLKSNIKEYWHCDGFICDTPNFAKHISYNRFILLNKFIHFEKRKMVIIS
ncbi:unnamed protein product [Parnassius apollo]|uniref:(apollo) hypothetical protein n=1 Tax=Parnassius apollo TaxID=110799 RepID=A0A8S3W265_PARAO|nr:unnamed protein product [Parnassius apollo]